MDLLPMSSAFIQGWMDQMANDIHKYFIRDLFLNSPQFLTPNILMKIVHSIMCESRAIQNIIKKDVKERRKDCVIDFYDVIEKIGVDEVINAGLSEVENWVKDPGRVGIWPENSKAFAVTGQYSYANCVVFGDKLEVIGKDGESRDMKAFCLPIDWLYESEIEVLVLARNVIEVAAKFNRNIVEKIEEIVAARIQGFKVFDCADFLPVNEIASQFCKL
jgi:hypothetical protein